MNVFITLTTIHFVRSIDTVTFKIALPREGNAASIAAPKLVFGARPETREYHYHCSRRVKDRLTGISASEQQATQAAIPISTLCVCVCVYIYIYI